VQPFSVSFAVMFGKFVIGVCVVAGVLWAAGVDLRDIKASILGASAKEAASLTGSDHQGDWGS
jgi:hypothetical protein